MFQFMKILKMEELTFAVNQNQTLKKIFLLEITALDSESVTNQSGLQNSFPSNAQLWIDQSAIS